MGIQSINDELNLKFNYHRFEASLPPRNEKQQANIMTYPEWKVMVATLGEPAERVGMMTRHAAKHTEASALKRGDRVKVWFNSTDGGGAWWSGTVTGFVQGKTATYRLVMMQRKGKLTFLNR